MNAKAWNARVICAWLSELMPVAARAYDGGYDGGRLTLVCYALILGAKIKIHERVTNYFTNYFPSSTQLPKIDFKGISSRHPENFISPVPAAVL